MENNQKKLKKLVGYKQDPNLASFNELSDVSDKLDELKEALQAMPKSLKLEGAEMATIKGAKGDQGDKGDKGDRGEKGDNGKDGKNGIDGKNGKDGKDGKNGIDGLDGIDGKDGKDGLNGKDGSPDTRDQIVEKINSGKEKDIKIEAKQIKGLPAFTREVIRDVGAHAGAYETPLKDATTGRLLNKDASGAWLITASGSSGLTTIKLGSIRVMFDGQGGVITTGVNGSGSSKFTRAGTITGWTIESINRSTGAAVSGSIVIDTWKDTYANFPATVADTIWGGTKPSLSSQSKNTASGLSIAVAAGDDFIFNVDSATTVQNVVLTIDVLWS